MILNKNLEKTFLIFSVFHSSFQRYGRSPSKELLLEAGDSCPICQETMEDPIELNQCKVRLILTHFRPIFHFFTPLKTSEDKGFLIFSGGMENE